MRRAIEDFLRENPDASDTPEGIVQWWLPASGYEDAVDFVQGVLDELVAEGVLRSRRLPDRRVVYSAVPRRGPDTSERE